MKFLVSNQPISPNYFSYNVQLNTVSDPSERSKGERSREVSN